MSGTIFIGQVGYKECNMLALTGFIDVLYEALTLNIPDNKTLINEIEDGYIPSTYISFETLSPTDFREVFNIIHLLYYELIVNLQKSNEVSQRDRALAWYYGVLKAAMTADTRLEMDVMNRTQFLHLKNGIKFYYSSWKLELIVNFILFSRNAILVGHVA